MEKIKTLISWYAGLSKKGKAVALAAAAFAVILVIELIK